MNVLDFDKGTNHCSYHFQGCLLVPLAMTNCMSLDVDLNGGRKNFAHYKLWISHICLILFTTNSMSMDEGTARSWIHLEDT